MMTHLYRYPPGIQAGKLWLELEKPWTLPNDDFMAHSHEYMEMTLITHGPGWHRVAGQEHVTAPGDVIIVPPGVVHSFFRSHGQTHRNFHFDPAILQELRNEAPDMEALSILFPVLDQVPGKKPMKYNMARLRLTPRELSIADQMMTEIDEEQRGKQSGQMASMRLILRRLFLFITRVYIKRANPTPDGDSGLVKSLDYMNDHLLKPLTLQQLAKSSGYSASHYRRLFKQAFGEAPINYLIRLRIRKACQLLEREKTPITEISSQCGFDDSNYFSRQFNKVMGKSPRRYREVYGQK
jgi:AraC-like DNA-binding protein